MRVICRIWSLVLWAELLHLTVWLTLHIILWHLSNTNTSTSLPHISYPLTLVSHHTLPYRFPFPVEPHHTHQYSYPRVVVAHQTQPCSYSLLADQSRKQPYNSHSQYIQLTFSLTATHSSKIHITRTHSYQLPTNLYPTHPFRSSIIVDPNHTLSYSYPLHTEPHHTHIELPIPSLFTSQPPIQLLTPANTQHTNLYR
jgi:hypothetical protein